MHILNLYQYYYLSDALFIRNKSARLMLLSWYICIFDNAMDRSSVAND